MKKVKLGEILSLKKGKKATVLAEQTTLSQRYIQIDDLRNNNNLKFTESLNMTEALPDDILIAWDGANAGTVGYGLSGAVGSTITVLKKNERYKEKIISDYLGVFLESKSQYLRDHSTGATIPHLNKNILLDLQLELLGIEEQENIICILNTIKRLITKRKFQLDELNLLVKFPIFRGGGCMKKVKLGQVATFINGYAFKPQDWSSEGKEIIRIQNLTKTSKGINYYSGTIDKKYIVEAGDILISWSGTLGVFQWCGRSAVLNQHIFKVVFDKIDIDKSYFKYVVEKGLQDAVKHTHGSTMKHLTKKYFDNIIVPYTNLGEQQRIASELDLLSKLILRRQEQLEELNLLVKSRFNEMFGDPLNNNKKFAVKTGQQCFKFSSGKFLDKHDRVFEGYPAYGGNGIAWKSRKYLIDNPTIIIGRVGAYCGNVRTTHGKVWISDNAIYIKEFKNSDFNLVFLLELMKVIDFSKFADFSGQPKITQKPLENQKYILPPLALQNEFADFVALVDKSQLAIQKSLEELETLKKSLMQEYFG
ncbi:TPA: restriction endonuclease subunit S [Streptococcus pneumoniae]|nr:restriction endonuclease subunit S [Streptococcus pneumoniae]